MKISTNWLKQFVKTSKKPHHIARELTLKTAEVEGIVDFPARYRHVVTGKIISVKPHPDADKLSVALINLGVDTRQIIFGSSLGAQTGWIVPVALPGAKLPNGMDIQKREMRGMESNGMICIDEELELPLSEKGIMIFPKDTPLGIPITTALGLDDVVLEIDNKSLSHRPDLWGQVGFAREVAAITGAKFIEPKRKTWKQLRTASKKEKLTAKIVGKKGVKRYMAVRIDGIKVGESSQATKAKILAIGLRPISNIVDITNVVMYEVGQPLHAFDARNIEGAIHIRFARPAEKLATLDGAERELKEADLLIADEKKGVALAGVMGGANSEIKDDTTSIIIESAVFDHATIRKTSRRLGLLSDASLRFEKTLDPEGTEGALLRACELVLEACPEAAISSNVADVKNFTKKNVTISVSHEYIEQSIGTKVPKAKVVSILKGLGFGVAVSGAGYKIKVPSFRATKDISIAQDIVEEVARIYGFENIPSSLPQIRISVPKADPQLELIKKLRTVSKDLGKNEVYTYSFLDERKIRAAGLRPEEHLKLQATAFLGQSYLRMSLVPSLLVATAKNIPHAERVNIFEIDRVFRKQLSDFNIAPSSKETLPRQPYRFVSITSAKEDIGYHVARGDVEVILEALGFAKDEVVFEKGRSPEYFDGTACAEIKVQGTSIGFVGVFVKNILQQHKIRQNAHGFVIDADVLASLSPQTKVHAAITKFPVVTRDIALVVNDKYTAASLREAMRKSSQLVKSVEVFDVYRGKGIPDDARSLAFRITYQDEAKTLTDKEVDEAIKELEEQLREGFQVQVRA